MEITREGWCFVGQGNLKKRIWVCVHVRTFGCVKKEPKGQKGSRCMMKHPPTPRWHSRLSTGNCWRQQGHFDAHFHHAACKFVMSTNSSFQDFSEMKQGVWKRHVSFKQPTKKSHANKEKETEVHIVELCPSGCL
jgi:hypothetical protein